MIKIILVIGAVKPEQCDASKHRLRRLGHIPCVEHHELRELLVDADLSSSETIRCQFDTLIVDASVWEEWNGHRNFYVHFRQLFEQNPGCSFIVANGNHCSQLPAFVRNYFLGMTAG